MLSVKGPSDEEISIHLIRTADQLSEDEKAVLERNDISLDIVDAVLSSDINPNGKYEHNLVVLSDRRLCDVGADSLYHSVPLEEMVRVMARDFVGNGILEVHTKEGKRVEFARYSKTLSESMQQLADKINAKLGYSKEEITAHKEEADTVSGPKEHTGTYRCVNCGYPLAHQGDTCPVCARKTGFLDRMWGYLKPQWRLLLAGSLTSLVVTIANLTPGYLVRLLVDRAIMAPDATTEERLQTLLTICGAFLGFIVIRFVTQHFRIRAMGTLGTRVVRALRMDAFRALQRLSLSYYDSNLTGRIMSRVLGDTQMVQGFVVNALQMAIINVLMILGISVVLFREDPLLAMVALGPVPIVILLGRFFSNRFKGIFRSVRRKYSTLSGSVAESVTGVRVVKSFGQEDQEYATFAGRNNDFYQANIAAVNTRSRFVPSVIFIMTLGTIVVWYVGGRQVVAGVLTLGLLLQFITYMNQFYAPIQQLIGMLEVYQQAGTSAERVFNLMNQPPEVADHDKSVAIDKVEGRIVVDNVSFSYQTGERILKKVNLTIEPGQMVGIVGQTGSGKSTLVSLICRFYDPDEGRITLDGVDLRNVKLQSLRDSIGMVLQDTFLFARTVKENIAYGNTNVSDAQIIEAAKAANAHEFIMNLPDGYDSEVGERGVTLSGGEKQRISIARAILKNPRILVLDEATSAVDSATESAIQEAMDRLIEGRTTIAIAHRLSTLRNADMLIVVEGGEIVEQGTHRELLDKNGIYANLVTIQADFAQQMLKG